jgi:hypothetical protein
MYNVTGIIHRSSTYNKVQRGDDGVAGQDGDEGAEKEGVLVLGVGELELAL